MSAPPATEIERHDDLVIVHVQVKNLDEQNTRMVYSDVTAAAAQAPALPVVLDMVNVKFLPSLTLGAIVRMANEFRARGQRLVVAAMQPTVRQVISITRLDRVFEIHDDLESALKAIRV